MYIEDKIIRLQLWDTAGQERFRSLIPSYIKDSCAAVVVYDITSEFRNNLDKATFNNVENWISDARAVRGNDVVILLVGNKVDIAEKRVISAQEGEEKAKEPDVLFCEASAKAAVNVTQMFNKLCYSLPGMEQTAAGGRS